MKISFTPGSNILGQKHLIHLLWMAIILLISVQSCKKDSTSKDDTTTTTTTQTGGITLPATALVGASNLTQWTTYKANSSGTSFNWILIGDSYTQGNFYTWQLHDKLLNDGYLDGGPGYCSFSREDDGTTHYLDQSIDPGELSFSYNADQWTYVHPNTIGTNGNVINTVANATITVTVAMALNTMTIVYEKPTTPQSFQYRVNGGAWTTVNISAATKAIGTTAVDVSTAGDNIVMEINPLSVGMNFCGVIGKVTGNNFMMNKCGISGAQASYFAQNDEWSQAITLLAPKAVLIQFGVNEQIANTTPADYKTSIQNIITKVRALSPNCDIILMSPPQNTYDTEHPAKYKQAEYAQVMYQLSLDNKTAYFNVATAFGPFSQASVDNGLMNADRTHPGVAGGLLMASTIFAALKK